MIGHPSVMSCFSIRIKHMDCYIYRVTLLLKEYTFIYLPHIDGLKGSWTDEYQTKTILVLNSYFSK
jgi:hypothetical protein